MSFALPCSFLPLCKLGPLFCSFSRARRAAVVPDVALWFSSLHNFPTSKPLSLFSPAYSCLYLAAGPLCVPPPDRFRHVFFQGSSWFSSTRLSISPTAEFFVIDFFLFLIPKLPPLSCLPLFPVWLVLRVVRRRLLLPIDVQTGVPSAKVFLLLMLLVLTAKHNMSPFFPLSLFPHRRDFSFSLICER